MALAICMMAPHVDDGGGEPLVEETKTGEEGVAAEVETEGTAAEAGATIGDEGAAAAEVETKTEDGGDEPAAEEAKVADEGAAP